ncbi:saccharopine dehydrogenase NADP-binding domain-containing protein [soil metagenome]
MPHDLIIYGAYGYTGELIAKQAVAKGLKPLLAGRDPHKLQKVAGDLGLEFKAFELHDTVALENCLRGAKVVLHCAGPFVHTYKPMMFACLKKKVHYLDITGEVKVFEAMARKTDEAKAAGIMFMPGCGFDVVPSDCLANMLKERMPDAQYLELAFATKGKSSRGTQKTVIEGLHEGSALRQNGYLKAIPAGSDSKQINFGDSKGTWTVAIPWGDISTAWFSTQIPNIKVYMALPEKLIKSMRVMGYFSFITKLGFVKNMLTSKVDQGPAGPSEGERESGKVQLWGEVRNAKGDSKQLWLTVPEGYKLTSLTAVAIAEKLLQGNIRPGFQTPASMYGSQFILGFEGTKLKEPGV